MPSIIKPLEWSFDYPDKISEGGIILKNIKHENYNLASDIRVINIWINPDEPNPTQLMLGSKALPVQKFEDLSGYKYDAAPPNQFSNYRIPTGFRCFYTSIAPVIPGGSRLRIMQTFLFSEYDNYPAHEPSGNLMAARLFPLIRFDFPDEKLQDDKAKIVHSIRLDYRIQYNLDLFLSKPFNDVIKTFGLTPQQAGVFKDSDDLPPSNGFEYFVASFGQHFVPLKAKSEFTERAFTAAEKPLQFEIEGDGLSHVNSSHLWDNTHFWGGCKGSALPSTPGAFHAAHTHWRWGKGAQYKSVLVPQGGEKQFVGSLYPGGPLVDPAIPDQDLKFFIVKSDIGDLQVPFDMERYFMNKRKGMNGWDPTPENISEGTDLVLYMSFTAYRTKRTLFPFSGTFFIHGLFFAHDSENNDYFKGTRESIDKGTDAQFTFSDKWHRNPSK